MEEKKVVFVPHCILNPNIRDNSKSVKEIVELFAESEVGIIQLPCPEIEYNGKLIKKIRNRKKYREHCKKLSLKVLNDVKKYLEAEYMVLGILGVEFSHTCGVYRVHNGRKNIHGKGIFMDELEKEMQKKNFQVPIMATNFQNMFSTLEKINLLIKSS
jgi:predicted secreted protein